MQAYTEETLAKAINELASKQIGELKHEVKINLNEDDLETGVKNGLFLIAREALTNTRLHAQAERAMILIDGFVKLPYL